MRRSRKLTLLAGVVALMLVAGAAFAYFTNTGTGSGTASVGTSSEIELSSPLVGTLYPGGDDVAVTVTIFNPGSGFQMINTVSGAVTTNGDCLGTWFVVDDIIYDAELAPGASDTADTAVRMLDSGTNQDVCKGLTMAIVWSSTSL
jgi:hypothetical protein